MDRNEKGDECLQMVVKSVNDTIGSKGLYLTLLIYGSITRPVLCYPVDS